MTDNPPTLVPVFKQGWLNDDDVHLFSGSNSPFHSSHDTMKDDDD